MATLNYQPNGRAEVKVVCVDSKRRTIRLGRCSRQYGTMSTGFIQEIADRQHDAMPLSKGCLGWIDGLDDRVRSRMETAGLLSAHAESAKPGRKRVGLQKLTDRHMKSMVDRKESTIRKKRQAVDSLHAYFTPHCDIREITKQDAAEWRAWLRTDGRKNEKNDDPISRATVARRTSDARHIFNTAIAAGYITSNPFVGQGMSTNVIPDPDRQVYVPFETIHELLKVCDDEWKTIIAMARFAMLRIPSEIVPLDWSKIDFMAKRMTIRSPKTEHHPDGAIRRVPIFPDLLPILKGVDKSSQWVMPSHRDPEVNLRQHVYDLLKRAGIKPWPKIFTNLRASCIRDLLQATHDVKLVARWAGNSEKVIMKYYLMIDSTLEQDALTKVKRRRPR